MLCKPACPGLRLVELTPRRARRDVGMQLFSLIMNASLCVTACCYARSGPGSNVVLESSMARLPETILDIGNNSNGESSCRGSEDQLFHYSSTPLLH